MHCVLSAFIKPFGCCLVSFTSCSICFVLPLAHRGVVGPVDPVLLLLPMQSRLASPSLRLHCGDAVIALLQDAGLTFRRERGLTWSSLLCRPHSRTVKTGPTDRPYHIDEYAHTWHTDDSHVVASALTTPHTLVAAGCLATTKGAKYRDVVARSDKVRKRDMGGMAAKIYNPAPLHVRDKHPTTGTDVISTHITTPT